MSTVKKIAHWIGVTLLACAYGLIVYGAWMSITDKVTRC